MKNKVIFASIIMAEILLFILLLLFFNFRNNRYDSWIEKEVMISSVSSVPKVRGIRNNQNNGSIVIFNDLDNNDYWVMDFTDYTPDIAEKSIDIIRCNPNNIHDAVYLDYENFKTKGKIKITILVFIVIVFITVCFYKQT